MSHDRPEAEGCQARDQPGEVQDEQEVEDRLPCLRWSPQPLCRQGEDRPRFPDRRAEDRHEGSEGPGRRQEGINLYFLK